MVILIPYITELLIDFKPLIWCSDHAESIPASRRFLKALYTNFRIMSYVVFLFRVLVVFKSWKLDKNTEKNRLKLFANENNVMFVSAPPTNLLGFSPLSDRSYSLVLLLQWLLLDSICELWLVHYWQSDPVSGVQLYLYSHPWGHAAWNMLLLKSVSFRGVESN